MLRFIKRSARATQHSAPAAKPNARSAHALGLVAAWFLCTGCGDREPAQANAEPKTTAVNNAVRAERPPVQVDRSTPRALLDSLLSTARKTRLDQARSALRSWNTVADFVKLVNQGSAYDQRLLEACPHLDSTEAFGALEWTWLGARDLPPSAEGAERQLITFRLAAYGISIPTRWTYGTPFEMTVRLPYWLFRHFFPAGATHPVRPRFLECVNGTAKPRMWLLSVEVQNTPEGWLFSGDTMWIEGLLLATEIS